MMYYSRIDLFALILSIICVSASFCQAQELPERPKGILKFSPLGIIDPVTPHLELGYEARLKERLSFEVNASYINYYTSVWAVLGSSNNDFAPMQGGRIRTELKFYFKNKSKKGTQEYVAPMLMFKMTDAPKSDWLPYEESSYWRLTDYSRRFVSSGLFVKYGGLRMINEKWSTDAYIAAGFKVTTRSYPGIPETVDRIGSGFTSVNPETSTIVYPAILFNYRFGYSVKQ